jgi:2,3,4,5-tetrahydropyridine-2-carboxylate N-succinyltransferase
MSNIQDIIEQAFEDRASFTPANAPVDVRDAVQEALAQLDRGALRVAEKRDGDWQVNQWLKKAVLLSFRLEDNQTIEAG